VELHTAKEEKAFSEKNIYTSEEKQYIMDRLNAERRIQQKKVDISERYKNYTEEEKRSIFKQLNEKRLDAQMYEEIRKKRIENKKIHTLEERAFYKVKEMDREYFLLLDDFEKLESRAKILPMYYKSFGELKKKEFLMKIVIYSEKIFISKDVLKVYFLGHSLEENRG